MFLRGIFINRPYVSVEALEQVRNILDIERLPQVVAEFVPDVFLQMNKGNDFNNLESVTRYSYAIKRNVRTGDYLKKVKKKEYNFFERDDLSDSLPFMTVDEGTISSELIEKQKENISWVSLINNHTMMSVDFKNEIIDYIDRFNDWLEYFYNVYATDLKILLERSVAGVVESAKFLERIINEEGNEDLNDVLIFLMRYIEFKEFLQSDDKKLTLRLE